MVACSALTHVCLQARSALAQSPFREVRRVRVELTEEGLVLLGVVSRYYFKQLAQETVLPFCKRVSCPLINRIYVEPQTTASRNRQRRLCSRDDN
jgi:hypothetical protein